MIVQFFLMFQKLTCCRVQRSGKEVRFYYTVAEWLYNHIITAASTYGKTLQLLLHYLKVMWTQLSLKQLHLTLSLLLIKCYFHVIT